MNKYISLIRTRLIPALLSAVLITSLGACSSLTDKNEPLPSLFSVFATLESHSKTGAVFTVQSAPDAEPVTLTTNADLQAEGLEAGKRYIIIYANGDANDPYIPGAIDLKNVLKVANGNVQIATKQEIMALQGVEYSVVSMFRTGTYINVQLDIPSTSTPEVFNIYADRATLGNPLPDLYLIYQVNSTGLSHTTAFGSFNIAEVWNERGCTGVNIDLNGRPSATFKKESTEK
ncbi:MAG: hypothetical protein K2M19_04325 [Muribaculaceae bacterium]|nr:hypothetical protein [Muribaculaceae bacterium]